MKRMLKVFLVNWQLRLIALFLALALWYFVMHH